MEDKNKVPYPKGEQVWVHYYNAGHELKFILTRKELGGYFFLYEFVDGVFKKLGKSYSPKDIEEKYRVDERLFGP